MELHPCKSTMGSVFWLMTHYILWQYRTRRRVYMLEHLPQKALAVVMPLEAHLAAYLLAQEAARSTEKTMEHYRYTLGSFIDYQRDFWTDTKATAASRTMTAELLVVGAAIIILCVTEGRRWGVRFVWLYALGSLLIGVSVGVPLFLIARERRMAAVDAPPTTPADSVLLTLLCIGLTSLALWVAFS